MKKALLVLSVLLPVFLFSGCHSSGESALEGMKTIPEKTVTGWDEIVKRNELRIGVPSSESSFDNELIEAFAEELEIAVTTIIVPWDESRVDYLKENRVDMLWGQIPATADTSAAYRLSTPYCSTGILYLSTVSDLIPDQGTVAGVLKHSAEEVIAKSYHNTVHTYSNQNDLFYALNQGECNIILYNKALYENLPQKSGALHIVKEVPCELVLAFEQNNVSVAAQVEKILAKIKAQGIASEICLKWYPKDLITK